MNENSCLAMFGPRFDNVDWLTLNLVYGHDCIVLLIP